MGLPPLDRALLITGTPRSGKSLVRTLLEPSQEFLVRIEPSPTWAIGRRHAEHDARGAEDASPRTRRRIRRDCQRALARSGRARYADELAHHTLRLPFIAAVLPEAKIVHVIRHPEDTIPEMNFWWQRSHVAIGSVTDRLRQVSPLAVPRLARRFLRNQLSIRRHGRPAAWGPSVPGLTEFAAEHESAELAAYQWLGLVETAVEDAGKLAPGRYLEIRNEKLVACDPDELRKLAEFCEVADPDAFVENAPAVVRPGEYSIYAQIEPSAEEWGSIWSMIGPMAARLGYHHDPNRVGRTILPRGTN